MFETDLTRRMIGRQSKSIACSNQGFSNQATSSPGVRLKLRGIEYERHKPITVVYKGVKPEYSYRIDLLIEKSVVVELKSIEAIAPIHEAVVLAYFKAIRQHHRPAYQLNVPALKEGVRRYIGGEAKNSPQRPPRSAEEAEGEHNLHA